MPAAASHLVTGNGFGFAVVAPDRGSATRFYPHPHCLRPSADPAHPLERRDRDPQLHQGARLGRAGRRRTADYVADSHVIRLRARRRPRTFFMPFGLERPALIVSATGLLARRMEPPAPLANRIGAARLLRFDGIDEPLLLIPLAAVGKAPADQPLAASSAWALVALDRASDAAPRCATSPLARRPLRQRAGHARARRSSSAGARRPPSASPVRD